MPVRILHDSPERSEVQLARTVCLPRCFVMSSCAGLLAFAAGGRFPSAASLRVSAGPAWRVQPESVRAELRARSLAAVVSQAALFLLLAGSVQRKAVA
jgi:hypothetical protein